MSSGAPVDGGTITDVDDQKPDLEALLGPRESYDLEARRHPAQRFDEARVLVACVAHPDGCYVDAPRRRSRLSMLLGRPARGR